LIFDKTSIYLIEYFIIENNSIINHLVIELLKSSEVFLVIKNKFSCNLLEKVSKNYFSVISKIYL